MTAESDKKMKALKRLFDMSPDNIDCEVRFGNVRDEIIKLSKEGKYDVIVIGSKIRALQPICWVQMLKLFCATPLFRY